jgi:hypothetical protein
MNTSFRSIINEFVNQTTIGVSFQASKVEITSLGEIIPFDRLDINVNAGSSIILENGYSIAADTFKIGGDLVSLDLDARHFFGKTILKNSFLGKEYFELEGPSDTQLIILSPLRDGKL